VRKRKTIDPEFGVRLADVRKIRGWSRAELSRRANLVPSTIKRYEEGKMAATVSNAEQLANALGVTAALLNGDPELGRLPLREAMARETLRLFLLESPNSAVESEELKLLCTHRSAPTTVGEWRQFSELSRARRVEAGKPAIEQATSRTSSVEPRHPVDGDDRETLPVTHQPDKEN
jgi:transcriptional regulator with XRE-family HTH domain